MTIDKSIEQLTARLLHAREKEAARILTRIRELEALKKKHAHH